MRKMYTYKIHNKLAIIINILQSGIEDLKEMKSLTQCPTPASVCACACGCCTGGSQTQAPCPSQQPHYCGNLPLQKAAVWPGHSLQMAWLNK